MTYRMHLRNAGDAARTLCNLAVFQGLDRVLPLARKLHRVDCRNCLSIYYDPNAWPTKTKAPYA